MKNMLNAFSSGFMPDRCVLAVVEPWQWTRQGAVAGGSSVTSCSPMVAGRCVAARKSPASPSAINYADARIRAGEAAEMRSRTDPPHPSVMRSVRD